MKANEFRIGNFVLQPNGYNRIFQITTDEINTYEVDDTLAIPLTEEWLIRLGFDDKLLKRIGETDLYIQGDSSEGIEEFGVYLSTDIGFGETDHPQTHIEGYHYVHQLQNLYFALTGEELLLK